MDAKTRIGASEMYLGDRIACHDTRFIGNASETEIAGRNRHLRSRGNMCACTVLIVRLKRALQNSVGTPRTCSVLALRLLASGGSAESGDVHIRYGAPSVSSAPPFCHCAHISAALLAGSIVMPP